MNNLVPFQQPSAAVQRRVQRELGDITIGAGMAQARIQASAEVEAARASAVTSVGQRAMQEVAMLTKLERDLCESVPAAQARLVSIGDLTSIALGSVVMNAARRLGQ